MTVLDGLPDGRVITTSLEGVDKVFGINWHDVLNVLVNGKQSLPDEVISADCLANEKVAMLDGVCFQPGILLSALLGLANGDLVKGGLAIQNQTSFDVIIVPCHSQAIQTARFTISTSIPSSLTYL